MELKPGILIVEDDANLATNLQHILELEGYRATIARDGQSALALGGKPAFDLAIIDIKLPDMSGLKLIEKLAELSLATEYIISTGYASLETAVDAVGQRHIVAYETKPLNMDHILSLVRQVTERQRAETALRESEAFIATVFDSIADFITVQDIDYNIIKTNKTVEQVFGKDIVGKKCYQVYQGRHEVCPDCPTVKVLNTGKPAFSAEQASQSGLVVEVWAFPIKDTQGQITAVVEHGRDIRERKQAEQLLQTVFDISPIGIYIVQDDKLQLVNPQLAKLTGYSQEEALGKESLSFVLPEDRKLVRENAMAMLQGKRATPYEYRLVDKAGKVRWVMETVTSIQYQGKRAVLGNYMDITDHKLAEKALETQKELTDRVLASIPNAVLVIDRDLDIVLANQTFCRTFRLAKAEVEGKPLTDVLCLEGLVEAVTRTLTDRQFQSDREFRCEVENREMIMVAQIAPMGAEEVLLVLRDATAERTRQEQLNHIDRLASIGEVAAGVAHELNNPLASVVGYSELVLASKLPRGTKADVEVIYSNAQRAVTIVRNLLAFARRQPPQKQLLNVNDLVKHVLEMRAYELRVSNIAVVTELADKLPEVMVDRQQLEQVFLNIILNAEQAMLETHNQGTLTVRTEVRRGMVRISFTDDGPGIPAENLKRVFDPFFTTKAPGKGTGLGLSICHGIVAEHGGRIYAQSKVGQGATFFVELPVAEAEGVPRENS